MRYLRVISGVLAKYIKGARKIFGNLAADWVCAIITTELKKASTQALMEDAFRQSKVSP